MSIPDSLLRPSVFISYSYDEEAHKAFVVKVAEDLGIGRVGVVLDRWDLELGEDIAQFMEQGISRADFFLAMCTPKYAQRFDSRDGGAGQEGAMISASVLEGSKKDRVIPALCRGDRESSIPKQLKGRRYLDFREANKYSHCMAELLGRLHSRPLRPSSIRVTPGRGTTQPVDVSAIIAEAERTPEWKKKLLLYEKAVELEPTNSNYHRKMAWCALNLNRFSLAEQHDREAVRLDPENTAAWVGLVVAGSLQGNREVAEEAFHRVEQRTQRTGAGFVEASFYLGVHLYRTGERSRAEVLLQTVTTSGLDSEYFSRLRRRAERYLNAP